jgi:hypothetical protein
MAAQRERFRFAGAGLHLFDSGSLSPQGRRILTDIERSRRFARFIKRHAPRLRSEEGLQLLRLEKAVRILCALDLSGIEADQLLLARIGEAFMHLRPGEPLQNLAAHIPKARPHHHPALRLYEDYRRYLLRNPLGADPLISEATPVILLQDLNFYH